MLASQIDVWTQAWYLHLGSSQRSKKMSHMDQVFRLSVVKFFWKLSLLLISWTWDWTPAWDSVHKDKLWMSLIFGKPAYKLREMFSIIKLLVDVFFAVSIYHFSLNGHVEQCHWISFLFLNYEFVVISSLFIASDK